MNKFFEANAAAAQVVLPDPPSPADRRQEARAEERHGSMGEPSTAMNGRGDSTAIRRARVELQSRAMADELKEPSYVKMIISYETNFDKLLREFMNRLARNARVQFNSHLANLVMRLDYNGFFTADSGAES